MWILAVVLSEAYITISKIAFKVEQEKNLAEESLVLTQVLQSVADEAMIDYERYEKDEDKLATNNWFSDHLYLTGDQRSGTAIYTTGNCLDVDWNISIDANGNYTGKALNVQDYTWCKLVLEQNGNITELISSKKVIISHTKFKIR